MKFSPDQGDDISVCTPLEVLEFREKRGTNQKFDDRRPMSPDVAARMAVIHKVHGFQLEGYTLELLLKVDFGLVFSYSFRDGYRFPFGDSVFPEWVKELDTKKKIIVYATMVLEAYGWVVTLSEDKSWYYLNFAPLQALTPEEVTREREQIAFRLAANALQVINQGLLAGKTFFTLEELAISGDDPRLFTACLTRLRQLMPRYMIEHSLSRLFFTPSTSP